MTFLSLYIVWQKKW